MKLSAVIIAKNEENNITNCIKSIRFADEIILIDNDSTDNTVNLALKLKARIYRASGLNFSALRNLGEIKAKGEWVFYLDADERVSRELASEIMKVIKKDDSTAAFSVSRQNYYFGKKWPYVEKMIRLIRKNKLVNWQGSLHESPQIRGITSHIDSSILHFAHSNLWSMVDKTNEWSDLEAELRLLNNHPRIVWWRFFRVMITAFWQSFIIQGGWKVGNYGIVESIYQSFSMFVTYAKLWEKQNKNAI